MSSSSSESSSSSSSAIRFTIQIPKNFKKQLNIKVTEPKRKKPKKEIRINVTLKEEEKQDLVKAKPTKDTKKQAIGIDIKTIKSR